MKLKTTTAASTSFLVQLAFTTKMVVAKLYGLERRTVNVSTVVHGLPLKTFSSWRHLTDGHVE